MLEDLFLLSRCDGLGAFYLVSPMRDGRSLKIVSICLKVLDGFRNRWALPVGNSPPPWASSTSAFVEFAEKKMGAFQMKKDVGGAHNGKERKTFRAVSREIAAALVAQAETETAPSMWRQERDLGPAVSLLKAALAPELQRGPAERQRLLHKFVHQNASVNEQKDLIAEILPALRPRPLVRHLGLDEERPGENWYGAVLCMIQARGEYRDTFGFAEVIREWMTPRLRQVKGDTVQQKIENILLEFGSDGRPGVQKELKRTSEVMKFMALWHLLGGETRMSAPCLLVAEDAERDWARSALACALVISSPLFDIFPVLSHRAFHQKVQDRQIASFRFVSEAPLNGLKEAARERANVPSERAREEEEELEGEEGRTVVASQYGGMRLQLGPGIDDQLASELAALMGDSSFAGRQARRRERDPVGEREETERNPATERNNALKRALEMEGIGKECRAESKERAKRVLQRAAAAGDGEALTVLACLSLDECNRSRSRRQSAGVEWAVFGFLPQVTRQIADKPEFAEGVRYLGKAASLGWVSPLTLRLGSVTQHDPSLMHGLEGSEKIVSASDSREEEMRKEMRKRAAERVRERARRLIAQAVQETGGGGLAAADRQKTEGNKLYSDGRYEEALGKYSEAVHILGVFKSRQQCGAMEEPAAAKADIQRARQAPWTGAPEAWAEKLKGKEKRAQEGLEQARKAKKREKDRERKNSPSAGVECAVYIVLLKRRGTLSKETASEISKLLKKTARAKKS
uniref:Uncharacterized protein n=1 Tax=Chromera velia CCMP2878 TaxID=1169474 RepID=A0A0G4HDR6_9ALVE|eukprot:Cvel_26475.t1-p1 / transcript=Cvel_26475.t1 / gene=Cvel_26475 / organism=Chromera_velia_CCMP2878 / gene_product=hypothetical protein / transcript_product=hypothetical protein / location=Cvel_scaffold3153:146-2836(+) / protein_length=748 / sequence_SO=supercontig / SO=protein_coding / is_pseudo=false